MSSPIQQMPLTEMLAAAEAKRLAQGWVYLPDGEIAAASSCVLIADEAYDCEDEDELAKTGARLGFPREGLDTGTIEDVGNPVMISMFEHSYTIGSLTHFSRQRTRLIRRQSKSFERSLTVSSTHRSGRNALDRVAGVRAVTVAL